VICGAEGGGEKGGREGREKVPPEDFWAEGFFEGGFSLFSLCSVGAEPSSLSSSWTRFSPSSAIVR